jgi:SpoVK/Ycf46/Vps4 family AAA+-type ATPase
VLDRMDRRVGMGPVKRKVESLVADARYQMARKQAGLPVEPKAMHMVFSGNPGTGKTTTARDIAEMYNALGLLPTKNVVEVTRGDLVAEYVGQTAKKTQDVLNKARGGVLFIDEAYNLARDAYGNEALEQIMTEMENNRGSMVVIAAGYPREMRDMINVNPGLRSRFPTRIDFPDYTVEEKRKISQGMVGQGQYKLSRGASGRLHRAVAEIGGSGNARDVRNLYDAIRTAHAERLATVPQPTRQQLSELTASDVRRGLADFQASRHEEPGE